MNKRVPEEEDEWVEVEAKPKLNAALEKRNWMMKTENDPVADLFKTQDRAKKVKDVEREEMQLKKEATRKSREIQMIPNSAPEMARKVEWGDRGSNWRMMKLKRVFETSQEDGLKVEDVAMDRYESKEEFEDAINERDFLDAKRGDRSSQSNQTSSSSFRAPIRKSNFKAPGQQDDQSKKRGHEQLKVAEDKAVRSVKALKTIKLVANEPILTTDQLNKMFSKVLKARIMKLKNLEDLEDDYQYELKRSETQKDVITIEDDSVNEIKGRLRKEKVSTHDEKGNRIDYEDSSKKTLEDLLREERMQNNSSFDQDIAHQISRDNTFKDNLDYIDESSDKLSRKKHSKDEKLERNAMKSHKRTEDHLDCNFCYHEDLPPRVSTIAIGIKTYLALPETIDMLPYHCLIVPIQHVSSTLELDDDEWDEIRNFQKCLIRMCESKNMGILFMEQVINLKKKSHTVIECIPVPRSVQEDAPAYFKEALLTIEGEWTQHKPILSTDRERGFRKSMVKNLTYFHIWFDPDNGYGHVIEDSRAWPIWFGKEVIASVLDLPPDKWRKPKLIEPKDAAARSRFFVSTWNPFDWTKMLDA